MPAKKDLPSHSSCLGGCGELIPIDTKGRRQKYVKNGGINCWDCVKKMISKRMLEKNPMDNPEIKKKLGKEYRAHLTEGAGNGRGYPEPQKILVKKLGKGWWPELVIPTGYYYGDSGLPTSFKIDIANIYFGIAIEIDGHSHRGIKSRQEDERKNLFLQSKGWKVLRFKNCQVMKNLDLVIEEIMSTILKSKETTIILPMDY
jgi:hypothetical protein